MRSHDKQHILPLYHNHNHFRHLHPLPFRRTNKHSDCELVSAAAKTMHAAKSSVPC